MTCGSREYSRISGNDEYVIIHSVRLGRLENCEDSYRLQHGRWSAWQGNIYLKETGSSITSCLQAELGSEGDITGWKSAPRSSKELFQMRHDPLGSLPIAIGVGHVGHGLIVRFIGK